MDRQQRSTGGAVPLAVASARTARPRKRTRTTGELARSALSACVRCRSNSCRCRKGSEFVGPGRVLSGAQQQDKTRRRWRPAVPEPALSSDRQKARKRIVSRGSRGAALEDGIDAQAPGREIGECSVSHGAHPRRRSRLPRPTGLGTDLLRGGQVDRRGPWIFSSDIDHLTTLAPELVIRRPIRTASEVALRALWRELTQLRLRRAVAG